MVYLKNNNPLFVFAVVCFGFNTDQNYVHAMFEKTSFIENHLNTVYKVYKRVKNIN